ncbi:hypothetical protein [Actinomadura geliboluensis]|uniref:Uncharacterized protein n=1 Tax=Actinomadura geliboluensis TaxID=882440 RepID=A0A5S4HBH0_9ACTN|nr:hypothetical protein [Actinomadura geliboluensis]TMR42326.1 hypothetical protein ETD96_01175 [Actinomadura geliboluensis]
MNWRGRPSVQARVVTEPGLRTVVDHGASSDDEFLAVVNDDRSRCGPRQHPWPRPPPPPADLRPRLRQTRKLALPPDRSRSVRGRDRRGPAHNRESASR